MTSTDWLNIANCAKARREAENLSAWWCSVDRPRFRELIGAETALILKAVPLAIAESHQAQ